MKYYGYDPYNTVDAYQIRLRIFLALFSHPLPEVTLEQQPFCTESVHPYVGDCCDHRSTCECHAH